MQIDINEVEYCKLVVHYEADAELIDDKKSEVIALFKKAPVPGFRKGKAGLNIIKMHYKKQIEESLKRALTEQAFHNTIFEKNIKPLGQPDFTSVFLLGDKFTCDFSISKKPDFDLGVYKDLEIPKPGQSTSVDELVEKMLEDLRTQFGESKPYDEKDFIQMEDKVILKYDALVDGVADPNLSSEGELLSVGTNPLAEFDQNLLGMKIGEKREFDVMVPDNGIPSYAGKKIHFTVDLTMGSKIEKMALDDELAKKIGKKDLNDLRTYAAGIASSRITEFEHQSLTKQVSARLVESHDFKVPEWLALSEAQYLVANSKLNWDQVSDDDKESYLKLAAANVKLALILDKVRDAEPDAQLSDQEVITTIKQNIAKQNQSPDQVLQGMNKSGYLQILITRIRDEHTLDFILKNSKIVE